MGPDQYLMPTGSYTSINILWVLMSQTMQTSAQPQANPANTKNTCTTPLQCRTNAEDIGRTLHRWYTKVSHSL